MGPLNTIVKAVTVLTALTGTVDAFWRLECHGTAGYGRIDPLVSPGMAASHNHAIHGSSNLGVDSTADDLLASDCTSCSVTQDKSAYWFPSLHFQYPNGTTVMVSQVGGLLAYYLLYGENIKAFPKGFSMIAGTSWRRNFTCEVPEPPKSLWSGYEVTQDALKQKALGFNCLNYAGKAEPSLFRHYMPSKEFMDANCPQGIRLEIMFPSCWNGKDLTSPDHSSHMEYPSQVMDGTCSDDFPVRTPSLFFESIWNTYAFKGQEGQFVFSNGDPTGFGNHADFVAAWEDGVLQEAVDTCTNPSGEQSDCPVFNLQPDSDATQCHLEVPSQLKNDNPQGPRQGLPGINPIVGEGLQKGFSIDLPLDDAMSKVVPASIAAELKLVPGEDGIQIAGDVNKDEDTPAPSSSSSSSSSTSSSSSSASAPPKPSSEPAEPSTPASSSAPATSSAPAADSSAPAPTDAPAVTDAPDAKPEFVTTIYSTSGSGVWEIFVKEVTSTVTADAPLSSAVKRHMHHHHYQPHHQ